MYWFCCFCFFDRFVLFLIVLIFHVQCLVLLCHFMFIFVFYLSLSEIVIVTYVFSNCFFEESAWKDVTSLF